MIGGIGSMRDRDDALGAGYRRQLIRQISHVRKAHLRNEVKVVFVDEQRSSADAFPARR